MAKYDPLRIHLRQTDSTRFSLRFSEIESILDAPLPKSAITYPEWWSNHRSTHVQAEAWLDAGYRTERIDFDQQYVTFVRDGFAR